MDYGSMFISRPARSGALRRGYGCMFISRPSFGNELLKVELGLLNGYDMFV